jgi:hypothetical protein
MTSAAASPNASPYVVTLEQVGSDVVATGSGSIDLRGLEITGSVDVHASIEPYLAEILTGPAPSNVSANTYAPISFNGPSSFGSGGGTSANIGSGDEVGIAVSGASSGPVIFVPFTYASDTPLSDSATYDNTTLASLGVTPGIYKWTWGTGADQSITLGVVAPLNTIIRGNDDNISVFADYSNGYTIIIGNGSNDFVSAKFSSHDKITLGDGADDTVQAFTSSQDKITLGNGTDDTVYADGNNHDTITLGNGAR